MSKIPSLAKLPIRKIAIFRPNKLGGFLVATPALRALRMAFPKAHIDYIGLPWTVEMIDRYPHYLNEFVSFPGFPGITHQEWKAKEVVSFLSAMQKAKYDLVIQMYDDGNIVNSFAALWGAPYIAGFAVANGYWPSQYFMEYPTDQPEIVRLLSLLEHCGIKPRGTELEFPVSDDDQKDLMTSAPFQKILGRPYACLHPGALSTMPWPAGYFAEVADVCAEAGLKVAISGLPAEKKLARDLISRMKHGAQAVDMTGITTTGMLAALIRNAQVFVGNDTGASHLAVAVGTRSVTVFSTSDPVRWAPLDTDHHLAVLPDQATPQTVVGDVQAILNDLKIAAENPGKTVARQA